MLKEYRDTNRVCCKVLKWKRITVRKLLLIRVETSLL